MNLLILQWRNSAMKQLASYKNFYPSLRKGLTVGIIGISLTLFADSPSGLPKTVILGTEYYIYETKKDESLYGIAKKFGWNIEELERLNPEVSGSLHKGERLYYPTGNLQNKSEEVKTPIEIDYSSLEPIKHKVKKGETIYSISRQYGIPLDVIYNYNPNAKRGVKKDDIIQIPQTSTSPYYFYTVKRGDSLQSLSETYNTSVEEILKNNAGLTAKTLREGEIIRLSVNSNVGKSKTEIVEENVVSSITSYKVSKNESWKDISEKTGVGVDILIEANEDSSEPPMNSMINVPLVETVEIEKDIPIENQGELSSTEVQEIYDTIKGTASDEGDNTNVKIALLLDDPNSNKDIDFTRGMLLSLDNLSGLDYKVDLKILDGRVASDNIINDLDDFEPNLIISTADKTFPLFLADYGNTNNVQIVNVFDIKNDLYEDNASIVQLLPPSSFLNDRIAANLYSSNSKRKLIFVGDKDSNDGLAQELSQLYENVERLSLEEFGAMDPEMTDPILIYSFASKKEEIGDFLTNLDNLLEVNPLLDFHIVGRANWIALTDDYEDKFKEYQVYVPSRVWLDVNSKDWKDFENRYEELFNGAPIRSIPNFAASGYDVANYFVPFVNNNRGDFNQTLFYPIKDPLQNEISLNRVNNWGGFINGIGYLIRFMPGDNIKMIVR